MIPLITQHSDQLAEICRRHHVKRLEVFGSAAVGDFNPQKKRHRLPSRFRRRTSKTDWKISLLAERLFIIIGEAITSLETHHPDIASQISDYRDIIGFRIILVHRYPEIGNQEV